MPNLAITRGAMMCDDFILFTGLLVIFAMLYIVHGMSVFARDYMANWKTNRADLRQPWKLVTLTIGTTWLLYGAIHYDIPDWDIGVSMIMASLTYVAAPWCARAVISLKWPLFAGVIIMSWFAVDGAYNLWHTVIGNPTFREANFMASGSLFWLCGFIWLARGSLHDIFAGRALLRY
jgi:hypothetical protein